MAKVGAIKVLEQIADVAQQNSGLGSPQSPGVCIIIQAARRVETIQKQLREMYVLKG
jgi:hypothetical protein